MVLVAKVRLAVLLDSTRIGVFLTARMLRRRVVLFPFCRNLSCLELGVVFTAVAALRYFNECGMKHLPAFGD